MRGRSGANSGNVHEPLDTRACDAFGGLDMRGMKCVLAALRIETYRIDQPVSASNRIGD